MKFTLPLTFDIDLAAWADEYDHATTAEAAQDIIEVLTRVAVADGTLAAVIVAQWPMMRDAAIVTVGLPGTVLTAIDWSDPVAAAEIDNLAASPATTSPLETALRRHDERVKNAALVRLVRATIDANTDAYTDAEITPVAVVFRAVNFDDGYFLTQDATVYFKGGERENLEILDADDLLNLNGACGSGTALGVDLRTGTVVYNDYQPAVLEKLGIAI